MAEVLVLVEHGEGSVKKVTLELLTAARELGEPAAVVVGAPGSAAPLVDKLGEYGATKVYACATHAEEDIVEADGIVLVVCMASLGADFQQNRRFLWTCIEQDSGNLNAVNVGGSERCGTVHGR